MLFEIRAERISCARNITLDWIELEYTSVESTCVLTPSSAVAARVTSNRATVTIFVTVWPWPLTFWPLTFWPFDLWVNTCIKFGVDSSSRFLLERGYRDRQTDRQRDRRPTHAGGFAGVGNERQSAKMHTRFTVVAKTTTRGGSSDVYPGDYRNDVLRAEHCRLYRRVSDGKCMVTRRTIRDDDVVDRIQLYTIR